jgi:hypothetical protein
MSEQDTITDDATSEVDDTETTDADTTDTESTDDTSGDDALGDAGKQALDRMKAKQKEAIATAKAATARAVAAEKALAAKDKPADEVALDAARDEARTEATAAANLKLAKSALRLAAKGVLADPADAIAFIDASQFEVDDEGDVDADALNEAITELLEQKPHLAAQKQSRFDGDADQGARGKDKAPPQWTEADLERANAAGLSDEIAQAKAEGLLNKVLGAKT